MSQDPPRYSIYAEVAPDQAEACFQRLSENMIQCTAVRFAVSGIGPPLEWEDIVAKGFKDDAQRQECWIMLQSAEAEQKIFCIHYKLQPDVILKLRKELPSCFVNAVTCQSPFYPEYCSKHHFYHFNGCLICNSGIRGLLQLLWIIPEYLWYRITSRFHGEV